MKTLYYNIITFMVIAVACISCKSKNDSANQEIIVPKPQQEVKHGTQSMQETNNTREIDWLGAKYKVVINRKPDQSLSLTRDEYNQDYYDNVVSVRILRADGSEAFNHVFHKTEFLPYISDSNVKKSGALLGVVFDKVEDGILVFAASVGSPNDKSDEYVPLVVHVNRMGAISIAIDTSLDGNASTDSTANYDDDIV